MYEFTLADGTILVIAASCESAANEIWYQQVGTVPHGDVVLIKSIPSNVYCVVEK